jgi:ribosomal-protein-alanine N-acetyltransferase
MLSDPVATRYMHFAHWTDDQRRQWFDWCIERAQTDDDEPAMWVIARKEDDAVIGWFGIGGMSDPVEHGERSFGYLLDRAFWRQGYMTEALRAVLDYEFGVRGTPRVSATCEITNVASARVMEKAGMRRETTVYDADLEGNWAHRHHYAITGAEHQAVR